MRTLFLILITAFILNPQAYCSLQSYIGEESYFLWRQRDGGTKQDGRLDGLRVGIDRIKPYCWYLGTDFLYATGRLSGKSGSGSPQKSQMTDEIFEARLGYTLQNCCCRYFFIPFVGWGYFKEVNNFHSPSPLPIKFTDTFNFSVVGFLSGVNISPLLSMGINFKVRFMQDGKSEVSEDPVYADETLMMENETLYRLEVPFTFTPCNSFLGLGGQFAPFYEFRHFGGREGFPFNYKDTKFNLLGMRLSIVYRF